ncbi:MAG: hypothetical protein HDR98_01125 [Bacteroides sp.]|nr:hypothetical protein [Bacteroides sp.]
MESRIARTLKKSDIKLRTARHLVGRRTFYGLEDVRFIQLHPQRIERGNALTPDASVVVSNTERFFICIDIAQGENGWFYSSYEVHHPTGGSSSWPGTGRGSNAGRTLAEALRKGLENLKGYVRYANSGPDEDVVAIADRALRKLRELCIRQMDIFEML